jgi:hypothetical protein
MGASPQQPNMSQYWGALHPEAQKIDTDPINTIRGSSANNYNTPLGHLEPAYQMYKANLGDQGNDRNYDLRGFWLNNVFLPTLKGNYSEPHVAGAHFTDKYKKPNHPTMSDESQYADPQNAGHWISDHEYQPAPNTNLQKLQNYLQSPEGEGMAVQMK